MEPSPNMLSVISRTKKSGQNELLLRSLLTFYAHRPHMEILCNIVEEKSRISLRLIEWFVTNYSKKNYTWYEIPAQNKSSIVMGTDANMTRFKVFNQYRLESKSFSKTRFDPFCRRERLLMPYPYDPTRSIETTLGQLNYFRWLIENHVIEYIEAHYDDIDRDMKENNGSNKRRRTAAKTTSHSPMTSSSSSGSPLPLSSFPAVPTDEIEFTDISSTTGEHENEDDSKEIDLDHGDDLSCSEEAKDDTTTNHPQQQQQRKPPRKPREELSVSACKHIKKEVVKIIVKFSS